jgi:hypothetical protein
VTNRSLASFVRAPSLPCGVWACCNLDLNVQASWTDRNRNRLAKLTTKIVLNWAVRHAQDRCGLWRSGRAGRLRVGLAGRANLRFGQYDRPVGRETYATRGAINRKPCRITWAASLRRRLTEGYPPEFAASAAATAGDLAGAGDHLPSVAWQDRRGAPAHLERLGKRLPAFACVAPRCLPPTLRSSPPKTPSTKRRLVE